MQELQAFICLYLWLLLHYWNQRQHNILEVPKSLFTSIGHHNCLWLQDLLRQIPGEDGDKWLLRCRTMQVHGSVAGRVIVTLPTSNKYYLFGKQITRIPCIEWSIIIKQSSASIFINMFHYMQLEVRYVKAGGCEKKL